MNSDYWFKQSASQPLFPDLLWSRPENRAHAGKLLIIGGNAHGFAAVGEVFAEAEKAGIGSTRVLLPDALQKVAGLLPNGEFAASTPSGSFGQKALGEWLEHAAWADGVLVAGDLARNSETAILLEKFTQKYRGQLALTKDAVDYITSEPRYIRERPDTLFVLSFAQLQKLASALRYPLAFTYSLDLIRLVDILHTFTTDFPFYIVTKHLDQLICAVNGQVSTTPNTDKIWRIKTAAHAATWWLQNPEKPFEALTCSLVKFDNDSF